MTVISFDPTRRYPRPCIVLSSPGKLHSGERWFTIDLLPMEHEGGGQIGIWDGTDYGEALSQLAWLKREGWTIHEMIGGPA